MGIQLATVLNAGKKKEEKKSQAASITRTQQHIISEGGQQVVSRPPKRGASYNKHPTDLRPSLAVSHAVPVVHSHAGETVDGCPRRH